MSHLVEIDRLTKRFGSFTAVQDLTFNVEEGTILGFIGPNGAGKTTTLKMLATILIPSSGDARIDGFSLHHRRNVIRRLIGYMPDVCGLYEEMPVHEYLTFFCSVYGIRRHRALDTVDKVLHLTGLEGKTAALCGALSRGMSQRLHLARVLLHDPKLLLLDEPASGLDPRARIEFKELMLTLKRMGKTLIISSHILSELAEMCDSVAIIEKSALVYCGPVKGIVERVQGDGRVFLVEALEEPAEGRSRGDLLEIAGGLPYVGAVREGNGAGQILVRFRDGFDEPFALNRELVQRGFKVTRFGEETVRLEEAFMRLTKGEVQ